MLLHFEAPDVGAAGASLCSGEVLSCHCMRQLMGNMTLQTSRRSKPGPGLLHHLLMHEDVLDLLGVITQRRGELSIKLPHTGDLRRAERQMCWT